MAKAMATAMVVTIATAWPAVMALAMGSQWNAESLFCFLAPASYNAATIVIVLINCELQAKLQSNAVLEFACVPIGRSCCPCSVLIGIVLRFLSTQMERHFPT